jgi:hypothetical protein
MISDKGEEMPIYSLGKKKTSTSRTRLILGGT